MRISEIKSKNKLLNQVSQKQVFFCFSVVMLVFITVPLLLISHYGFMCADDYSYAQSSINLWRENHSIIQVLNNQFSYALNMYSSWQGTFSMAWLGSSLMVIIGEHHYFLTTYLTLGGMIICELILFMMVGTRWLGADYYDTGIVSCWLIALQILMVPYPVEAFYWLCSALLYTVGLNLSTLLLALLFVFLRIYEHNADKKKRIYKIFLLQIGIVIISILLSFGNFVSAIFCFTFLICLTLCAWIKRMPGKYLITLDLVIFSVFFALNVLAPGNRVRMAVAGTGESNAVKAILKSVFAAAEYIVTNLYPTVIIILVMMIPFIVEMVKKKASGDPKAFRYPLLFSVISFGLYASQFVPTVYSIGILGAGRVINIYRQTMYIWLFTNIIYWIGWIIRRFYEEHSELTLSIFSVKKSYLLPALAIEFAVLCFAMYFYGGKTITTVSALASLSSGQARTYHDEYVRRMELLHNDTIKDVYLEEFSDPPYLIFLDDIKEDPENWLNRDLALFYGKDSVVLVPKSE